MSLLSHIGVLPILLLSLFAVHQSALAIDDRPLPDPKPMSADEVARMVDDALPSLIGEDNSELVRQMLGARLGAPISKNLNPQKSIKDIFGRSRPKFDPDCPRTLTASGDPSSKQCTAFSGNPAGQGEYKEFAWDKQLGFGNVHYLRRPADATTPPGELPEVKMSDETAFKNAINFLIDTMGIPNEEIPVAPAGAANPFPVRTLTIGEMSADGKRNIIPIMKMVHIQRGLLINLKDPQSERDIPFIHGPGEAFVLLNDSGIWQARVQKWRELERSSADPKMAKTRQELIDEISRLVMQDNARVASLHANLAIKAIDALPGVAKASSMMLPGLEISVAAVPRDPSEEEQEALGPSTAGQTLIFSLLHLPETTASEEDN